MNAHWMVVKYMPDLRRREPINLGVMLSVPGHGVRHRFVAQRDDGQIDGRSARPWVESTANYKRWVRYWTTRAASLRDGDLRALLEHRPDDSYFLEFGGERLMGTKAAPPETLLEVLYTTLVESLPPVRQLDVSALSAQVFARLNIVDKLKPDFTLNVQLPGGAPDRVRFDYRYDNGQPNLMQKVSLTFDDERSWHYVHAATWAFEKAHEHFRGGAQHIALVKPRPDDDHIESQLRVLEEYATVVDVTGTELAATQLRDLFHLAQDRLPRPGRS